MRAITLHCLILNKNTLIGDLSDVGVTGALLAVPRALTLP